MGENDTSNKRVTIRPNIVMLLFFLFLVISPAFFASWLSTRGVHELIVHAVFVVELVTIPVLLYLLISRQKPKNALSISPLGLKNGLLVAGVSLAIVPIIFLIIYVGISFGDRNNYIEIPTFHTLWLGIITGGIIIASFEELFMRGPVYHEYRRQGVSFWKIALITSLLFGIAHSGIIQISYTAVWGFVMAYMLYITHSIWAPILSHVIINTLGHVLNPVYYVDSYTDFRDVLPTYLIVMGAAAVAMLPIGIICWKKLIANNPRTKEKATSESKAFTISYWVLFAIMIALTILREVNS